jgi:hypothetical protein
MLHNSAALACCPGLAGPFPALIAVPARALLAFFSARGARVVPAGTVAPALECDAFRTWIDGLKEEGNEALVQVRQWGFTDELSALQTQLRRALEATPPNGLMGLIVAWRLLTLLGRLQGAVCFLLEEK